MTSLKFKSMSEALAASRQFRESRKMISHNRTRSVCFLNPAAGKDSMVRNVKSEEAVGNVTSLEFQELKKLVLDLSKKIDEKDRMSRRDFSPGRNARSPVRSRSGSPIRCYNCGGMGHIASKCPSVNSGNFNGTG